MNYDGVNMITCGFGNCYVVRGRRGDILIDTCTKEYRGEIEVWLHNYDIRLIVLTHGHNDHIGNAAYFSKLFGADIAMCVYDMKLARDNSIHKLYSVGAAGKLLKAVSTSPKILRETRAESLGTDIFLDDGMSLGEDFGADCTAVKLDGHTKGSYGVLCGSDLYVGDAAMNFVRPSFPLICESPKAAGKSLERIRAIKPKRIFFGHGKPVEEGTNEYRKLFAG